MRRFHFWNNFDHISPSDGAKKLPVRAKLKMTFLRLSPDCRYLRFFWLQIRNPRKKLHIYRNFQHDSIILVEVILPSLFLSKNRLLLFAEAGNCSGTNRNQIRKIQGRKYILSKGILLFFLKFQIHYVRHSLSLRGVRPCLACLARAFGWICELAWNCWLLVHV